MAKSQRILTTDELSETILYYVQNGSDRENAVVLTCTIEEAMKDRVRHALFYHLSDTDGTPKTKDTKRKVTEDLSGLLNNTHVATSLAISLQLLEPVVARNIRRIYDIRNIFAHYALVFDPQKDKMEVPKFELNEIASIIGEFEHPNLSRIVLEATKQAPKNEKRAIFMHIAVSTVFYLSAPFHK